MRARVCLLVRAFVCSLFRHERPPFCLGSHSLDLRVAWGRAGGRLLAHVGARLLARAGARVLARHKRPPFRLWLPFVCWPVRAGVCSLVRVRVCSLVRHERPPFCLGCHSLDLRVTWARAGTRLLARAGARVLAHHKRPPFCLGCHSLGRAGLLAFVPSFACLCGLSYARNSLACSFASSFVRF